MDNGYVATATPKALRGSPAYIEVLPASAVVEVDGVLGLGWTCEPLNRRSPDGGCQGFFHKTRGEMMMAGKPSLKPNAGLKKGGCGLAGTDSSPNRPKAEGDR
jgi:hypothetical protein